ncbi:rhamnan synthesis F family protein [uncultured Aureimonas sp.]|uniref:rhamnan synthesis F family protein n=1 Tax=uncultured Aureimonas sp. TaxID=1604662 RepID=UPI0025F785F9|nr:rhamnan synthesis F family protein [uncultured Aureimonas sp.]
MNGVPIVFVHVHHPDVWEEMARDLATAIQRPFGLVLTCRDAAMTLAAVDSPHVRFTRRVVVENRGRDVLPFMKALRNEGDGFEIGLKLHTKKSVHRDDGDDWRRFLTRSLLAGRDGVPAPLVAMEKVPSLGLVVSEAHLLGLRGRIVLNGRITRRMISALGLDLTLRELEEGRFAAGSMFWFRREALSPLADPALDSLFAPERGQLDGTAAHAAERLFAALTHRQGYLAAGTEALPALLDAAEGGASRAEMDEIVERSARDAQNPFVLPMSKFWQRHPWMLIAAHHVYTRSPQPIWRVARKLFRRFTLDR